jgi:hypothetical protein
MFDFLMRSAPMRTRALADRGLTPNDSRALFSLDVDQGRSMRSLADAWECDPSNVVSSPGGCRGGVPPTAGGIIDSAFGVRRSALGARRWC